MVRALAFTGMAVGFLAISPKLRDTVWSGVEALVGGLDRYSPASYAAVAAGLVLSFLFFLRSTSRQR
jgi:hypothetical protein